MIEHRHQKRVRYGETDQMGYLYYGQYALYYEIGRVEWLRALGVSYREMEHEWRVMMPVLNMHSRFIRPAHYDDLVTITTQVRQMAEREIVFHFELHNEAGKLLNGGRVALCFIDMESGRRVSCPSPLVQLLAPEL